MRKSQICHKTIKILEIANKTYHKSIFTISWGWYEIYVYIYIMWNGNLRLVPFIAIDSFLLFNILSTFCRPSRENTDTSNIRYHYSFKEFLKCIKVALVQKNNHQQLTCRMQTIYLEMFVWNQWLGNANICQQPLIYFFFPMHLL